jgi:hypothetical protein
MPLSPVEATLIVSAFSAVVVPLGVAIIRHYLEQRRAAKQAALDLRYVTKSEQEMQFEELAKMQERQHRENKDRLDVLRYEGHEREDRINERIDAAEGRVSTEIVNLRNRVDHLHKIGRA